jgi:transcriptional regulator GlxA family with amidase domain
VVQIRVTRETWNPLVGAALATLCVTDKTPVLNHAFARAFLAETGLSPAKAVDRLRAELARDRVEDGKEPLDAIARAVGFSEPERMRQSFIRSFGQPPQAVRRVARLNR